MSYNQMPFLPNSRVFPEDLEQLSFEVNKTYVDTANCVNSRTIGIFTTNKASVNGENWFLTNQKQQALRQVFSFGTVAAGASLSIPYQLNGLSQFCKIYGTCITNTPDYRPLPYASVTANANVELKVTPSNIVISVGAASPNVTSGIIILEWLSAI